jgi:DNA-binding winged helix-turn-helix (wHTH) protein/Tol biopolymer transport system component
MLNGDHPGPLIRFGAFEADLRAGELRKHGLKLKLQEQPFRVLAVLLEQPGQVVTREDLQKKLWAGNTFVDFDSGLNKAMNRLREVLADSAENPRFIQTLPKRGYRFIAPVETVAGASLPPPTPVADHVRVQPRFRDPFVWSVALALLIVCVVAGVAYFQRAAPSPPPVRSSLLPPPNTSFLPSSFELSPDGTRLAFVAAGPDGRVALWTRLLSVSGAHPLDGTDGARFPFRSPDNRYIGFFAAGKLKTLDVASGVVHVLCDAPAGMGGTWSRGGVIVFAPDIAGPLYRIAAAGGTPAPVTAKPREGSGQNHVGPWFLPDGQHFLYSAVHSAPSDRQGNGAYVGSLGSVDARLVSSEFTGKVAFSSGRLLYVRRSSLVAQPFDASRLQTAGSPAVIAEQELDPDPGFWGSTFSVSQTGLLAFQSTADSASHLVWTDESGKSIGQLPGAGYKDPAISPDGRLMAVSSDAHDGRRDILVYDLARGVSTRLTSGGNNQSPVWSRDSKEIAYASREANLCAIYRAMADGSRPPQVLMSEANIQPNGWSRDNDLIFGKLGNGNPDLEVYSMAGHQVRLFTRGVESQFSPDGKWIAYVWRGVYVQSFPGPGHRIQISDHNGGQPRWSRDGRQLFYIAPDRKLMAVGFDPKKGTAGPPRVLFQTHIVAPSYAGFQYDVAPDGRFLINASPSDSSFPLTLIVGWTTPGWTTP